MVSAALVYSFVEIFLNVIYICGFVEICMIVCVCVCVCVCVYVCMCVRVFFELIDLRLILIHTFTFRFAYPNSSAIKIDNITKSHCK